MEPLRTNQRLQLSTQCSLQPPPISRTAGRWSANEKWRGADQCTVVDLPHEEVRDIHTTDDDILRHCGVELGKRDFIGTI